MGGAPPLPHNFAPQGVKNWPFLAIFGTRGSGAWRTPFWGPETLGSGGPKGGSGGGWGPPTRNPVRKRGVPEEEAPPGTNYGDSPG